MTDRNSSFGSLAVLGRIAVVLLSAVILWVALTPIQALAANSDGNCETYEVCIYKHDNLGGVFSDYRYYSHSYVTHTFDSGPTLGCPYPCWQNDEVSSLDSWDTRYKVRFFVDSDYDGAYQTLVEYGRDMYANYNDAYSSHCWNDGAQASVDPQCNF